MQDNTENNMHEVVSDRNIIKWLVVVVLYKWLENEHEHLEQG